MINSLLLRMLLLTIKRGKFRSIVKVIELLFRIKFILPNKILGGLWGNFLYLQFRRVQDYSFLNRSISRLPNYNFKKKRVLVFLELHADARIIKDYLSEASSVTCYYEGKLRGIKDLTDRGPFTYYSLNETITAHDTTLGQSSLTKNTQSMNGFKRFIDQYFDRNRQLRMFRGHSHAIAQSTDAKFLQTSLHCDTIASLLVSAEYDSVCLVVADGALAPLMLNQFMTYVPEDRFFIASTRRSSVFNHRYFRMIQHGLEASGKSLHPTLHSFLLNRTAKIKTPAVVNEYILSNQFSETVKQFVTLLPNMQSAFPPQERQHVFYPLPVKDSPVGEGIANLIESLFQVEKGISIIPQLLSAKVLKDVRDKEAQLKKTGAQFSLICFEEDAENTLLFQKFMRQASELAAYILSRFIQTHKLFQAKGDYREFFDTPHFQAIMRDFSTSLMNILILGKFVMQNEPRSVICYPSALPAARILTTLARKQGSLGIDVQPFFVMDEPRTMFHHAKNGDYMFIQSAEFAPIYEKLGYQKKNIFVTGTPRTISMLEQIETQKSSPLKFGNGDGRSKVILFADQITNRDQVEKILEFFYQYCRKNTDVIAIYRPHYRQQQMNAKLKKKLTVMPNLVLGSGYNIYQLIMSADVVVTYFSNVVLESAVLEKPVVNVYLTDENYPEPLNLHEWGISSKAIGFDDLEGTLDGLLHDDKIRQKLLGQQRQYLSKNPQYTTPVAVENIGKQYISLLGKHQVSH